MVAAFAGILLFAIVVTMAFSVVANRLDYLETSVATLRLEMSKFAAQSNDGEVDA